MRYSWLFIIPPIVILGLIILAVYRYHKKSKERDLKRMAVISHTRTIKMLPAYRRAIQRYRILLIFAGVSFLISIFSFTAVAARPIASEAKEKENNNRDIILCLDTSGSMSEFQRMLLEYFKEFAKRLKGERVGITIFDGVPANIVPLSDDYDAVIDITNELERDFLQYGSAVSKNGVVSAIGDGVVGCINSFDKLEDSSRSKSVIIATDNQAGSDETVDINQAARYAKRYNVTFYGISTNSSTNAQYERLYKEAVSHTGGTFHNVKNDEINAETITKIVDKIAEQESSKITGAPEITYHDSPVFLLIVSGISFTIFAAIVWRLRL
ncbi:VWA domain-containing protein [Candidatus Saccharibacteria bacterium]|nr:VWA domain-containing protein [Candidatus Saccharibacteria bacterium]